MLGFIVPRVLQIGYLTVEKRDLDSQSDREKRGDRLQTIESRSGQSSGRGFVDGRHLRAGSDDRWRGSRRCGVLGGGVCVVVALPASVVLPVAGSAPFQDRV
jgi:hypothetical protein